MADKNLDCSGLRCPMPILKITKAMQEISSGQTLEVMASDPSFEPDINAWASKTGHTLVRLSKTGDAFSALIQKK